jgi:hypothetical protein
MLLRCIVTIMFWPFYFYLISLFLLARKGDEDINKNYFIISNYFYSLLNFEQYAYLISINTLS